jgi:hypothetical protein
MKRYLIYTLLALLPAISVTAQPLEPLKSLNVGNMWIYRLSSRLAPSYGTTGEAVERVLTKTIINGREYAQVYNSYHRSVRYERSDSNNIYVWNGMQDTVAHTTLWKVGDTVKFRMLWHGCDTCRYRIISASRYFDRNFLKDSVFSFVMVPTTEHLGVSISFNYNRKHGLNQIDTNGVALGNNGLTSRTIGLTFLNGLLLDGKVLRDTNMITSVPDDPNLRLAQSKQGSTTTQAAQPRIAVALSAENPFTQRTQVRYRLEQAGIVELAVYSTQGVRLTTVQRGYQSAGEHTATWNGTNAEGQDVPSGAYFLVVFVNDKQAGEVKVIKQR